MSGLSEAELHVQAMRLVCEALQDREQDGLEVDWDVIRQMHDQMDAILQALQHKHRYDSSEIVDLRKDRDHWKQARQDAHEAGELMRAEIERLRQQLDAARAEIKTLRKELADAKRAASDEFTERQVLTVEQQQDAAIWQQQLDAANAMVVLQRAGIERLNAFVEKVRDAHHFSSLHSIERALAQLDETNSSVTLTSSPAPVAEPATCPECERLQAFVGRVRELLAIPLAQISYDDMSVVRAELAALDDEPTPVAEPLDAEGGA